MNVNKGNANKDGSATSIVTRIRDRSHLLRGLDLDQVDGLGQAGLCGELAGVQHTAAGGDDLAATTVDGVSVHHHIAHLFAPQNT